MTGRYERCEQNQRKILHYSRGSGGLSSSLRCFSIVSSYRHYFSRGPADVHHGRSAGGSDSSNRKSCLMSTTKVNHRIVANYMQTTGNKLGMQHRVVHHHSSDSDACLPLEAISLQHSPVQPKEEPKAGSLFAALRRYRDPPAAAATTAQPSSPASAAAEEGQQPTGMDRAHSGSAPAALQAARQEDASRRSWFNRLSGVYTVAGTV